MCYQILDTDLCFYYLILYTFEYIIFTEDFHNPKALVLHVDMKSCKKKKLEYFLEQLPIISPGVKAMKRAPVHLT